MTTSNDLRAGLMAVAKRSVAIVAACSNEESTKMYLVLPVLGLLGYDYSNPWEVYPEHPAGIGGAGGRSIDFAILKDGQPVIAVECVKAGAALPEQRALVAESFNALPTVKLAILTNGIVFEFFVDSAEPNRMDEEPFLTIDLETISRVGIPDESLDSLLLLVKEDFEPETVAETAHIQIIKKRLRTVFVDEARGPSDEFCRFFLEKVGLKNVRRTALERHYAPMIRTAFEESLVMPVVQRLRTDLSAEGKGGTAALHQIGQRVQTSGRELAFINYVRQRLAYLATDEAQYQAIESVQYRDYVGKLVIYYDRERKGRLFDYIEAADGYDKYIFPEPTGEIVTNNRVEIDEALKAIFATRLRELGGTPQLPEKLARIA